MSLDRSVKNEYLVLFIIYLIAHGLMLTCNGIFWDDWVLYNVKSDGVIDRSWQSGAIWVGYFRVFMLSLPKSILFHRLLVFLLFMFSGFFLNEIMKKITEIDNFSRVIIVIFFLIFPVNSARITLVCAPYALGYFSFFFAFWKIKLFPSKIFFRLLGAGLFFFSFSTNSLLVYYLLFLIFLFYSEFSFRFSLSNLKKYLLKNIGLIFLPILFWIIKCLFLRPYGLMENYNTISAKNIIQSPHNFYHLVLKNSFFDVIRLSLDVFNNHIVVSLGTAILILIVLIRLKYVHVEDSTRVQLTGICAGIFALFLGVFPYLAVGSTLRLDDWDSRNQLLVPLGAALIICYVLNFLLRREVLVFVFSFFIAIFLLTDILVYLDYQKDWYKQLSLVENFRESEIIRNNSNFIMADGTFDLNANQRIYRFYEYTGLMKKTFNNQIRFAEDEKLYRKDRNCYNQYISDNYNMADYVCKEAEYKVVIRNGTYKMSSYNVLKLRFHELFDASVFLPEIKGILNIHYVKITNH